MCVGVVSVSSRGRNHGCVWVSFQWAAVAGVGGVCRCHLSGQCGMICHWILCHDFDYQLLFPVSSLPVCVYINTSVLVYFVSCCICVPPVLCLQ